MDDRSGIITTQDEVEKMSLEEQSHFIPLSRTQAKKLEKIRQSERVSYYQNNMAHKKKQLNKRRGKNKRKNKNRRLNK